MNGNEAESNETAEAVPRGYYSTSLTSDERLALLVAMDKTIKPMLDDMKSDARAALLAHLDDDGGDRHAIMIDGVKVGNVSITYSKPKIIIKPGCEADAMDALAGCDLVEMVPLKGWADHYAKAGDDVINADTGELAPWAMWCPGGANTASVNGVHPSEVMRLLRAKGEFIVNVNNLLEGGNR